MYCMLVNVSLNFWPFQLKCCSLSQHACSTPLIRVASPDTNPVTILLLTNGTHLFVNPISEKCEKLERWHILTISVRLIPFLSRSSPSCMWLAVKKSRYYGVLDCFCRYTGEIKTNLCPERRLALITQFAKAQHILQTLVCSYEGTVIYIIICLFTFCRADRLW